MNVTDEWTVKVLKVIGEILPFALSLSGSAWAYFYAMTVIGIEPWPRVTEALTACWLVSASMVAVLSCSFKLREVPTYVLGFLRIVMEPVWFMFVFLLVLSWLGVVSLAPSLVGMFVLVVIILATNAIYLSLQIIFGVAMGAIRSVSK